MIAQSSPSPSDVAQWTGLGVAAILGWFLFYKTSISDPNERKENRTHIEAIVRNSNETVNKVVERQEMILHAVREECKEERKEFLIELQTERTLRAEIEEKRQDAERQRHADHMAMATAINRLCEQLSQSTSSTNLPLHKKSPPGDS